VEQMFNGNVKTVDKYHPKKKLAAILLLDNVSNLSARFA
jgi:hypothetical protein